MPKIMHFQRAVLPEFKMDIEKKNRIGKGKENGQKS